MPNEPIFGGVSDNLPKERSEYDRFCEAVQFQQQVITDLELRLERVSKLEAQPDSPQTERNSQFGNLIDQVERNNTRIISLCKRLVI